MKNMKRMAAALLAALLLCFGCFAACAGPSSSVTQDGQPAAALAVYALPDGSEIFSGCIGIFKNGDRHTVHVKSGGLAQLALFRFTSRLRLPDGKEYSLVSESGVDHGMPAAQCFVDEEGKAETFSAAGFPMSGKRGSYCFRFALYPQDVASIPSLAAAGYKSAEPFFVQLEVCSACPHTDII